MNVKEIEQAIVRLSAADVAKLSAWFAEFEADFWDKRLAQDQQSGRLDQLLDEAEREFAAGRCEPL